MLSTYLCTHAFTPMQSFHFTMSSVSTFTSPCTVLLLLSLHHVLFCSYVNQHVLFCFYVHFTMYCSVPMLINMYCTVSTFTSPCIVLCSITMYCSVSMFTSLCAVLFPHPLHHVLFCFYLELFKKEQATTRFPSFFKNNLGVAAVSIKNYPRRSKTV